MTDTPWTVHFLDGSSASQIQNPRLPFDLVFKRIHEVYKFYLHLAPTLKAGVRMTDGFYYFGPNPLEESGWFPGPQQVKADRYRLYYSRSCRAGFNSGALVTTVMSHTLGWSTPALTQAMVILPDETFSWKVTHQGKFSGDA